MSKAAGLARELAILLMRKKIAFTDDDLEEMVEYLSGNLVCDRWDRLSGWVKGCLHSMASDYDSMLDYNTAVDTYRKALKLDKEESI